MEKQITVALYNRDHLSRGSNRKVLGYEAYHWGIIITPEVSSGRDCLAFEATDASEIDQVTWRMNNPTMSWWLRKRDNVDPALSFKLLGRVVIGKIPPGISETDIEQFLREKVPLPIKDTHPQQSCVTWVVNAIRLFQGKDMVSNFDMDRFKDWVLDYADEMMAAKTARGKIVTYEADSK